MSKLFLLIGILFITYQSNAFKDIGNFIPKKTQKNTSTSFVFGRANQLININIDSVDYYLENVKDELNSKLEEGKWDFFKACVFYSRKNNQKAIEYYQKALRIFSVLDDVELVQDTYAKLGDIYLEKNDIYSSINYYLENYNYLNKKKKKGELENKLLLAEVSNKLGTIFKQIQNYTNAKRFFWEAYLFAGEEKENHYIEILSFIEWCNAMNQLGKSKVILPQLIDFREKNLRLPLIVERDLLICLANTYQQTGDFIEAQKLYAQLFTYEYYPFSPIEKMRLLNTQTLLYISTKNYADALDNCFEVKELLSQNPDLLIESRLNELMIWIYFYKKNYSKAAHYSELFQKSENKINELEIENAIQFWDSKAKYEKQIYQDSLLFNELIIAEKNKNILNNQASQYQSNESISLLVILILAIAFIITILIVLQKIREKNRQLSTSLGEKEVLLKEVHHRVKNNFQIISSLLNLQANLMEDEEKGIAPLKEAQNRIYSMSLVHQKIYSSESLENVDMASYLEDLIKAISSTFLKDTHNLTYTIETNNILFPLDKAVPIGLISNELISNSLKYGKTNPEEVHLEISLSLEDGQYVYEIQDRGKGFPKNIDFTDLKSLGIELVSVLTSQLNGKWHFENRDGAYICIVFP